MMLARATGGAVLEDDFRHVRARLLADPSLASRLPSLVRTCRSVGEFWALIKTRFETYAARREFIWSEFRPIFEYLERSADAPSDDGVGAALAELNSAHVQDVWQKALGRRHSDPEGAITT